mgnify:CR=1 FL=1
MTREEFLERCRKVEDKIWEGLVGLPGEMEEGYIEKIKAEIEILKEEKQKIS